MEPYLFNTNRPKSVKEKFNILKHINIYPYNNTFYNSPFGANSNIFNATVVDILHTMLSGIMKCITI